MSTSAATAWADRPGLRAASPQDLAALLDPEVDRVEGLLFTGCTRPAAQTDKDHRIPWPVGRTSAENLVNRQ